MFRTIKLKDGSSLKIESDPSTGGLMLTANDADGNARATMTVGKADGMMITRSFEDAFAAAGQLTPEQLEAISRREGQPLANGQPF